jgi:hypothetical protein
MSGLDGLGWPNPEDEPKPKKNMTETEARTVALLRMHFGCTFGKLAMCCQALWDADRCEELTGYRYGSPMGQGMVIAMEDYFKLERCESDNMSMGEQRCAACGLSQVAISRSHDTPKQCGFCGEFASMWDSIG